MKQFDARAYSVADFIEWRQNSALDLSPKFQRRSVWTRPAKSFLIDTIVRGKPMPKILITQELKDKKNIRTVVDGQQRIRTILDYVDDGFTVMPSHNKDLARKYYSDLDEEMQQAILQYEIGVDLLYNVSMSDMLDIFSRINTYSVTLNSQEKLNAKYLGPLKTESYLLAHKYASFLLNCKVVTEAQISRMGEAELASELLIALLDGIQSGKAIERYYKEYEKSETISPELEAAREDFDTVMSYISLIYPQHAIKSTNWRRPHLFYTLFTSIAKALRPASIDNLMLDGNLPALDESSVVKWRVALDDLSSAYDEYTDPKFSGETPRDFSRFIEHSRRATTDKEVRIERSKFVLSQVQHAIS